MRLNGLAGVGIGSALAILGFVGSVFVAPPAQSPDLEAMGQEPPVATAPRDETRPERSEPQAPPPQTAMRTEPSDAPLARVPPTAPPSDQPDSPESPALADAEPKSRETPQKAEPQAPANEQAVPPALPDTGSPNLPDVAALADSDGPELPQPVTPPRRSALPSQTPPPAGGLRPETPGAPESDAAPATGTPPPAEVEQRMPGNPVRRLPGQAQPDPQPDAETPPPDEPTQVTALERNSSFDGTLTGAPLMGVVLNDPGLPMPLRRALAALELPITVALNPMDPSAGQAADVYRDAGKDVLILASGIPAGARATDLDVTFNAWFDSLPQAIGVLDLPRDGFSRNTALTSAILPLIARDGHGLVSFSGGLSRLDSAAAREGVPHAEIFRVLDDESQSPFTIRRYLDRAVFQASQIGQVIVFGDATNDATMEALEMWRDEGRADQVTVVPVSAILLTR